MNDSNRIDESDGPFFCGYCNKKVTNSGYKIARPFCTMICALGFARAAYRANYRMVRKNEG